jgi:uncharacterized protein
VVAVDVVYLDASALVKLLVSEPGSDALRAFLADVRSRVTSRIAAVEVSRAVARRPGLERVAVDALLGSVSFRELDSGVARIAASVRPVALRSLDAIHLASALTLLPALDAFVTYDDRLGDAARAQGLRVESPT